MHAAADSSRPRALLGVDVGGTFTDAVVVAEHGTFSAKRPTTPQQELGVLDASLAALDAAGLAPSDVARFAHGTTIATNALLERRLARTALVVTEGFGDVLRIARQRRPSLFDLDVHPVEPVVERECVVELAERIGATGVVRALDEDEITRSAAAVAALEPEAVAVCLLHAWRDPSHEERIAEALRARLDPSVRVVASHELSRELREYERACTTSIDAALGPVASPYLERLLERCERAGLPRPLVMQSSGGLASLRAVARHPARAVLSGPAGGVVAATRIASAADVDLLACIDVGGTSSDVAIVAGQVAGRSSDRTVAGLPLQLDMLDLRTIGSGGSSIVHVDSSGLLRVGPRSAGSVPGPAAWRRGGTRPTLTDCHVVIGTLAADTLAHWGISLDREAARVALRPVASELAGNDSDAAVDRVARAAIDLACEDMAEALRSAIVARGDDPARAALLSFGGAGGLHACAVAERLGATTVLAPIDAGVLSADGLARADALATRSRSIGRTLDELDAAAIADDLHDALRIVESDLPPAGGHSGAVAHVDAACRFAGQTHTVRITADELLGGDASALADRFADAHRERFGFVLDAPVVLESVHASLRNPTRLHAALARGDDAVPTRRELGDGAGAIDLPTGTLVVPAGWDLDGVHDGCLRLQRRGSRQRDARDVDTAELAVIERRLAGTCEEMGEALVRSAASPNITERRDSSTALFDAAGRLVAQAAHVPVHLGSMQHAVDAVLAAGAAPDETWAINDPYLGGTHLPDITLVRIVAEPGSGAPLAIAAARAHHADVGGVVPGSMSPTARTIDSEGVRIEPTRIGREGLLDDVAVDAVTAGMRDLRERRTDLRAQHAALVTAARRLPRIADELGARGALDAACRRLVDHGIATVRAAIAPRAGATGAATRPLELPDGSCATIDCSVVLHADRIVVDYTGTDPAGDDNLNAPAAVTRAAAAAALRCTLDPALPAAACDPAVLDVRTTPGSRLHAIAPSAVSGGNTEVSSVAFDCALAALGDALGARRADGQGTMNDLVLGWDDRAYYETIAGGQGASVTAPGADAVHVAMTNTATTPTEALELSLPVRVERHAVRADSGGAGARRGGDGVVRALRLLDPATVTFLGQRRSTGPAGVDGGRDGQPGEQLVDGVPQPAMFERVLPAGTLVEVRTPGGGGCGAPDDG